MSDPAYALVVWGTDLYAAGYFTNAGGVAANHIAKRDGTNWSVLGSGINGPVFALAGSSSDLYAAGASFTTAGGTAATNIAKWSGSSWSALGSGIGGVRALVMLGSDVYVGGYLTTAGSKVSAYMARARIGSIARSLVAADSTASIEFSGVTGYQYDVQRANSFSPPITWTTVTTSPLSPAADGSFTFTDAKAPAGMGYYRSVGR